MFCLFPPQYVKFFRLTKKARLSRFFPPPHCSLTDCFWTVYGLSTSWLRVVSPPFNCFGDSCDVSECFRRPDRMFPVFFFTDFPPLPSATVVWSSLVFPPKSCDGRLFHQPTTSPIACVTIFLSFFVHFMTSSVLFLFFFSPITHEFSIYLDTLPFFRRFFLGPTPAHLRVFTNC